MWLEASNIFELLMKFYYLHMYICTMGFLACESWSEFGSRSILYEARNFSSIDDKIYIIRYIQTFWKRCLRIKSRICMNIVYNIGVHTSQEIHTVTKTKVSKTKKIIDFSKHYRRQDICLFGLLSSMEFCLLSFECNILYMYNIIPNQAIILTSVRETFRP